MKLLSVLLLTILLAGCKGSGSSSGSSFFSSGGSSSGSGGLSTGGSGSNSGSGIPAYANPEPNTIALMGIGLAGLAVAKLRNRKKR